MNPEQDNQKTQNFADRLRTILSDTTVSAFARKVGLSESLIRKYLKGSEPSLSRADQIARHANVSLEWLATGCGYQYRQAEVVDQAALALACRIAGAVIASQSQAVSDMAVMTLNVSVYQYLRSHKKSDGYLDEQGATAFAEHAWRDQI